MSEQFEVRWNEGSRPVSARYGTLWAAKGTADEIFGLSKYGGIGDVRIVKIETTETDLGLYQPESEVGK